MGWVGRGRRTHHHRLNQDATRDHAGGGKDEKAESWEWRQNRSGTMALINQISLTTVMGKGVPGE